MFSGKSLKSAGDRRYPWRSTPHLFVLWHLSNLHCVSLSRMPCLEPPILPPHLCRSCRPACPSRSCHARPNAILKDNDVVEKALIIVYGILQFESGVVI